MAQFIKFVTMNWLKLSLIIFLTGYIINCFELFTKKNLFSNGGFLDWKTSKISLYSNSLISNIVSSISTIINLKLFFSIITLISVIYFKQFHFIIIFYLFFLILAELILSYRMTAGTDGAQQLTIIYLITIFFYLCFANSQQSIFILYFACSQIFLSYLTAGLSKLQSSTWRKEDVLFQIFSTSTYGKKNVHLLLKKNKFFSIFLKWCMIFWELLFFSILFTDNYFFISFILLIGLLFHFLNAFVMGLNTFFTTFISIYPIIIYCKFGNLY